MLLHLDGSRHQWFQNERWYDLIETPDDATSETCYAQLVEEESRRTVMTALREVIERKGRSCALYSDLASHKGAKVGKDNKVLGVALVERNGKSRSPQMVWITAAT